jgi:hypothetical protein
MFVKYFWLDCFNNTSCVIGDVCSSSLLASIHSFYVLIISHYSSLKFMIFLLSLLQFMITAGQWKEEAIYCEVSSSY